MAVQYEMHTTSAVAVDRFFDRALSRDQKILQTSEKVSGLNSERLEYRRRFLCEVCACFAHRRLLQNLRTAFGCWRPAAA